MGSEDDLPLRNNTAVRVASYVGPGNSKLLPHWLSGYQRAEHFAERFANRLCPEQESNRG